MSLSREQAIEELKHRGLPIPGENNQSENRSFQSPKKTLSKEQAIEELKRRGLPIPGEDTGFSGVGKDIWQGAKEVPGALWNMAKALPSEAYGAGKQIVTEPVRIGQNLVHGLAKLGHGVLNTPANIAEYAAKKEFIPKEYAAMVPRQEEHDFSQILKMGKPKAGDALISGLVEYMPYLLGGEGGLATGIPRTGQRMAAAGTHAVAQNENPVTAALSAGLLEGGARGIGSIADTISSGKNLASNMIKASKPEELAKKIAVTDKNAVREAFSKRYDELFQKAGEAGIKDITAPKVDIERIVKHTTKDESHALSKFLQKPTLKRAHEADKDLGKAIRRLTKINKAAGLSTPKLKALHAAKKAQKKIQKSIKEEFKAKGKPEIGKEYSDIKNAYKEEYIPYKNQVINKYLDKELTSEDFVKKLSKNEKFKAQMGEKYPELHVGTNAKDFAKNLIKSALGTATGFQLSKLVGLI